MNAAEIAAAIAECRAVVIATIKAANLLTEEDMVRAVELVPVQLSNRRSAVAGSFRFTALDRGRIVMNIKICHTAERFRSTLLHEFAHGLVHWLGGRERGSSHGRVWKAWMVRLGQEPSRCHTYDLVEVFSDYYTNIACKNGHNVRLRRAQVRQIETASRSLYCRKCPISDGPLTLPVRFGDLPKKGDV